ncbi:Hsp20 family protein [Motilimonas sp. E26]|uniref:Hsp20 family protein n=1 Tax=Motilimonas TaxID=1914248 RepID=UPI001E62C17D|nr:Hsp20 family protein [Motilimonas sp. E26]MCE0555945.1 Hsp20 family protein [Motilimonas sp. E26]
MNPVDLTPLYRSSIGFDRLGALIDNALASDHASVGYPPYNIEVLDENRYAITVAVAGFTEDELDIQVEKNVLTICGKKPNKEERKYLYQGIANRSFERKFNLADFVKVTGADLNNGLLMISLVKEIPEAMKPKTIMINQKQPALEHAAEDNAA